MQLIGYKGDADVSEEWEQNHPITFEDDKIYITIFFLPSFLSFHTKILFYELKISETKKQSEDGQQKIFWACAYTYLYI